MAAARGKRAPVRSYGITPWGRAFAGIVESAADHRHITGARRYFREHLVDGLAIGPGLVTASVRGSQLDPFDVTLRTRTVDAATVVDLLRRTGGLDSLLALARGEQPAAVGELIAPTEAADISSSCTCPDEAPRCIHVLATSFEVADRIDRQTSTLLRVMGTDLPELLAQARDEPAQPSHPFAPGAAPELTPAQREAAFFGDGAPLPAPPSMSRVDVLTDLDIAALRAALRASGVAATQLAEALDDLAELYAVLRHH